MLTQEQLAARKKGIGGSDAAAIVGISEWKTAVDVYLEKTSIVEPKPETEAQYWGKVKEPVVRARYEKDTRQICEVPTHMYTSDKYPWMIANIDALVPSSGIIVEIKTAHERTYYKWGEPDTDDMPEEYILQCAHYAIVLNAERVDLAVLIGASNFRKYFYQRNPALEQRLIEIERKFWHEHVLAGIPPKPKTLADNLALWPTSNEKSRYADNELLAKIYELSVLKEHLSILNIKEESLKAEIQAEMKEADTLIDLNGNKLATWKTQNRKAFSVKESTSRVFRLTKQDT